MRAENISRSKANKLTAVFVAAAMTFFGVVYSPETIASTTISQLGVDIDGEAAGDESGSSVSLSEDGSRVAIGAHYNDETGSNAGHVRIYDWDGTAWTQAGADIDGEAEGDNSGLTVSLSSSGSRVAIGARYNDENGSNAGHVRIYDWNGTAWTQAGADIDGEAEGDNSGVSVSLSADGSRVAIGAHYNDETGSNAGHVRIYDWDGTAWTQAGADIDGEAVNDYSGVSVSLSADGSRVAIGAIYNDETGSNAGHVRIYDWDGTTWNQAGADIDGEAADDQSGNSVSLSEDGSRLAIGARKHDGARGHVRIYDWDGTTWNQAGADIDGEAEGDNSGVSVSLRADGSRVAIGARYNDENGSNAGHVRIYDWNGTAWTQAGADIDGEAADDQSGRSISLSSNGSRVAIGARINDGFATDAGHVRIFSLPAAAAAEAAPAPAPAQAAPYQGPIPFLASPGNASAGEQITVTGLRLNSISSVQIDGVGAAIVSVEYTRLVFTLPNGLKEGTKSIVFYGSHGKLTFFASLEYKAAPPPAVLQPKKVNAGSFNGYVAVYAKGYEGQKLSAKVAGKWLTVDSLGSGFERILRYTGAGYQIKVDLYINGILLQQMEVTTR
jgi:predicted secreted hydrolase